MTIIAATIDGRRMRSTMTALGLVLPGLAPLCLAVLWLAPAAAAGQGLSPHANYLLRCSGCHQSDGSGTVQGGIPPFPGFVSPLFSDEAGRTYVLHVPGVVGSSLSDSEIAAVLNYVVDQWGEGAKPPPFTENEVRARRAVPMPDLIAYRREIVRRLSEKGVRLADYPWP